MKKRCIVLALSLLASIPSTAMAEVRMLYPFLPGESTFNLGYDTHDYPAFDIDTTGHPTVHAPISGTVIEVISAEYDDNKLTGAQLPGGCTPKSLKYGNSIRIQAYDGTVVLLAHLRKGSAVVVEGESVAAGQAIAQAGSSGWVCAGLNGIGDHLHIEYRDGQSAPHEPTDRFCEPLKFPGDDPGDCDVGDGPADNGTCDDGIQNQNEEGIDCDGPCAPCDEPPVCANGERRRCWVECAQDYPPECIYGGHTPLIMGIETCGGGTWGECEVDASCQGLSEPCAEPSELFTYECVSGELHQGFYSCGTPLGANCSESFYQGWPVNDCEGLCTEGAESCDVEGAERDCEVYCNEPNGQVVEQGIQLCKSLCGSLVWGQCNTGEACSM